MSSVERVLDLLGTISRRPRGASLKEISAELELPPPSVHRLLRTCVERGFCDQDPDSLRYLPGPGLVDLARATLEEHDIVSASAIELRHLRDQTGEIAFLTTMVGVAATCVAVEPSDRPVRLHIQLGLRMPFHASAAARAILAFRPEQEAKRLLGNEELVAFTDNTPTTIDDALDRLPQVREDGYASSYSELDENTIGVAAPVRDRQGEVTSSLCVALPLARFPISEQAEVAKEVIAAAERVSISRGWRVPD